MKNALVTIIIPTYNNRNQLVQLICSLNRVNMGDGLAHIIVVNNGVKKSLDDLNRKYLTVIDAGKNLGWEGGLKLGLSQTESEYVMFLNDDTLVPDGSIGWLQKMLQHFINPKVGAVGPSSNVVMGRQNMIDFNNKFLFQTSYLIGFCILLRRSILEKVGGVDDSLPGGDDLDLSIRLDNNGYAMLVDRSVFVYHYGFQTGTKLYGDYTKNNGWNNHLSTERTNFALIQKHGFIRWYECLSGVYRTENIVSSSTGSDTEGKAIRMLLENRRGIVYEFGCGSNKTVPEAIGFDIVPKGHTIDSLSGVVSVADECLDVTKPFPERIGLCDTIIARHILEHCLDTVGTLKNWKKVLRPDGKLILAVPNHEIFNSIPVNMEHVHAFTPNSLASLLAVCGFTDIKLYDAVNNVSFIAECTNV